MEDKTKELLQGIELGEADRAELDELRRDRRIKENLERELEIIKELFPDFDANAMPDELFEKCSEGKGLAGEYALWQLRMQRVRDEADKKNESNSHSAPPQIHDGDGELYFTPEQVRTMSRRDVRRHYKNIIKSMEKWK